MGALGMALEHMESAARSLLGPNLAVTCWLSQRSVGRLPSPLDFPIYKMRIEGPLCPALDPCH